MATFPLKFHEGILVALKQMPLKPFYNSVKHINLSIVKYTLLCTKKGGTEVPPKIVTDWNRRQGYRNRNEQLRHGGQLHQYMYN
jgi:hypothetical protein